MTLIAFILNLLTYGIYAFGYKEVGWSFLSVMERSDMIWALLLSVGAVIASVFALMEEQNFMSFLNLAAGGIATVINAGNFLFKGSFSFGIIIWVAALVVLILIQVRLPKEDLYISRTGAWAIILTGYWYATYQHIAAGLDFPYDTNFSPDHLPSLSNIPQWTLDQKFLVGVSALVVLFALIGALRRGFPSVILLLTVVGDVFLFVHFYMGLEAFCSQVDSLPMFPITSLLSWLWPLWFVIGYIFPVACIRDWVNNVVPQRAPSHSGRSTGSGDSSSSSDDGRVFAELPTIIYDSLNNRWIRQHNYTSHAVYEDSNGNTVTIYHSDISGTTATTSAGNFHWY